MALNDGVMSETVEALAQAQRFAAFCDGELGGNPAAVVLANVLPRAEVMQQLAAEIGYSETVFAAPHVDGWRVRYFAPEKEVPFCGHATIALGAALANRFGDGEYRLTLNANNIVVGGHKDGQRLFATLESPPTRTEHFSDEKVKTALDLFSIDRPLLDKRIPPKVAIAGARHLILILGSRDLLRAFRYDFQRGREWMNANDLTTILVGYAESASSFHTRNAFAAGGVYEDPATGAATAALAGYLRELQWPLQAGLEVVQGEDMGCKCRIFAEVPKLLGGPIRISGSVRKLD